MSYFILCYLTFQDLSVLQQSSLWTSALMLSGINQDILQTYNKLTVTFTVIAEDFAIYFFTFVIVHLVL